MLFLIAGSLYISFLCFCWGNALLKFIQFLSKDHQFELLHISIVCLTGLAGITLFCSAASFFVPLGKWYVQVFFFLSSLISFFRLKNSATKWVSLKLYKSLSVILLSLLLLLLLSMGSWKINHPDTLGYHAQIIEWIRDSKIIPGLAHLNLRYGLQSLWFAACALFDFSLPNSNAINLLNFTVSVWYVFFLIKKIDTAFVTRQREGLLWIGLLIMSLWNYPQIRLTITSASPDFIVSVLLWAIIYLLLRPLTTRNLVLATLFCFWVISIKLSSLPVILIAFYAFLLILKKKNYKAFFFALVFSVLLFTCLIVRNVATTGYFFYPATFPDIVNADWKINNKLVEQQKKYIAVYARTQTSFEGERAEEIYKQKMNEWIPIWWNTLRLSDKLMLFIFLLSLVGSLFFLKRVENYNERYKILLAICFLGILFWFYLAPDLRFGNGFIIGFAGIASTFFLAAPNSLLHKRVFPVAMLLTLFVVAGYTFYRFYFFFSPEQILFPVELTKPINKTVACNGVEIQFPINQQWSQANIDDCKQIIFRGKNVTDGFQLAQ